MNTIQKYETDRRTSEAAIADTTAALAEADRRLRGAKLALESAPADAKLLDAVVEAETVRMRAAAQHEATRSRLTNHREVWLRDHALEVEAELAEVEAESSTKNVLAQLERAAERVAVHLRGLAAELEELRQLEATLEAQKTQRRSLLGMLGRNFINRDETSLARLVLAVNIAARTRAGLEPSPSAGDGPAFGSDPAHLVFEWPRWRYLGHAVEARLARLGGLTRGVQEAAEADAAKIGGAS